MDLSTNPAAQPPPPLTSPPPTGEPQAAAAHVAHVANPTLTHTPAPNHPPYAEMITAAIEGLKERDGSSKRAIAKYIESNYSNLPSTHPALLAQHLKLLKSSGQLVMVKHSYALPRSASPQQDLPYSSNNNNVAAAAAVGLPKKRPGRPPKVQPNAAVPVFAPQPQPAVPVAAAATVTQPNVAIGPGTMYVPVGPPNGSTAAPVVGVKRGRGRPPKQVGVVNEAVAGSGVKHGRGRPPKGVSGAGRPRGRPRRDAAAPPVAGGVGVVVPTGRGRGRPRRNAAPTPAVGGAVKGTGRPRGRPPKVVPGGMVPPVAGGVAPKRRGRPPKAAGAGAREAKKPRQTTGKPGRPRKNAQATAIQTPDSQVLIAYQDLKGKFSYLQSRVVQTASVLKPYLTNETAALGVLQELERLAYMDNLPYVQGQQPQPHQPQQQPQPEHSLPHHVTQVPQPQPVQPQQPHPQPQPQPQPYQSQLLS